MRYLYWFVFVSVFSAGAAFAVEPSLPIPETARFPSLISILRIDPPMDFCGEPAPLDNPEVRERLEKQILLTLWDRAQVILWIKRSGRYMPYIEKMLQQHGLPDDLKYVAIVESALRPHIGSSKGAMGFWQFIQSTGRRYGLRIDRYIDERRNIFKSTEAAISYLKKLHGDFGSWALAAAAYNMGERGLQNAIDEQKTSDYYHLYLPLETQQYIFKILATKMILTDLPRYGFHLNRSDLYSPMEFDRVEIEIPGSAPVQLLAEASGTYFKTIKDLNPEIRGSYLTKGAHSVLIPRGAAETFAGRFKELYKESLVQKEDAEKIIHVVKKGDFLSGIAEKYRVPLSHLLRWNNLRMDSQIHPGNRLVILK